MTSQENNFSGRKLSYETLISTCNDPVINNVKKWNEKQVQIFFQRYMNGRYKHLASSFKMIDGIQLFNLNENQMKEICGKALGSSLYESIHPVDNKFSRDDDESHVNMRSDSELEDQLNFYSRSSLPPLITKPSVTTIIVVTLLAIAISICIFVFEPSLKDFFRCVPTFTNPFIPAHTLPHNGTKNHSFSSIIPTTGGEHQDFKIRLCTTVILQYASIPVVSVVFTYVHIWLALWMVFYPVKFRGCLQIPYTNVGFPFGWQGIVPFKAEKMARKATLLMTTKLINIKEIFGRIDPNKLAEQIEPCLHSMLSPLVHNVAEEHIPYIWKSLPNTFKEEIVYRAEEEAPQIIENMMKDIKQNIESVFNLEEMVVEALKNDRQLLNDMFIKCGYEELAVIRDFAAWMGFVCGMVQLVLWYIYPYQLWTLPVFAGVVGMLTNYIALLMIFVPRYPKKINFWCTTITFQGLFLARQKQVSAGFAYLVTRDILSTKSLLHELLRGHSSDALVTLIYRHVRSCVDKNSTVASPLVTVNILSETKLGKLKQVLSDRIVNDVMPEMINAAELYMDETLDLRRTIHDKMSLLTPLQFEELLRPVFEEDEWKLIVLGGVLGVGIGFLQTYLLGM